MARSRRRKLKKFAELSLFRNVFDPLAKGKQIWVEYFGNDHPITIELACGTGAYTLGLARLFPEKNCIGIDIKGARIWRGAKTALEEHISNAAFLRAPIERLEEYFLPGSVEAIWIPFPDPFPRKRQWKHRLTSPRF